MKFDTHLLDEALVQRSDRLEVERKDFLARVFAALDALGSAYGIQRAYIFGSVVRPHRFHEHSDVDIAVETTRPELLTEALASISSFLKIDVDLINLASVPFAERIRREGELWTPSSS